MQLHTDLDVGNKNIRYVLAGEGAGTIFAINELTGDIHAMKRLDREEKAEYTLTAQVINRDTNEPLEPPSEFIIKVQDINDNPPQFIEGPYQGSVPEMSPVGESAGILIPNFIKKLSHNFTTINAAYTLQHNTHFTSAVDVKHLHTAVKTAGFCDIK